VSLVVLDTDVASSVLRGRVSQRLLALLAGKNLVHLVRDAGRADQMDDHSKLGTAQARGPGRLAPGVTLLGFDETVATTWGELQARAQHRGRPRPVNDTWIAACCLVDGLPLATLNTKDFADFAEHDGLRLLDLS
jgi:predicted nucleic acid-binding protein